MQTDPIFAIRTALLDVIYSAMHSIEAKQLEIIDDARLDTTTKLAIIQELNCLQTSLNNKSLKVIRCTNVD